MDLPFPRRFQPVISVRISLVNVMTMPPATVRMPFARCDGSCDLRDRPNLQNAKAEQDQADRANEREK